EAEIHGYETEISRIEQSKAVNPAEAAKYALAQQIQAMPYSERAAALKAHPEFLPHKLRAALPNIAAGEAAYDTAHDSVAEDIKARHSAQFSAVNTAEEFAAREANRGKAKESRNARI